MSLLRMFPSYANISIAKSHVMEYRYLTAEMHHLCQRLEAVWSVWEVSRRQHQNIVQQTSMLGSRHSELLPHDRELSIIKVLHRLVSNVFNSLLPKRLRRHFSKWQVFIISFSFQLFDYKFCSGSSSVDCGHSCVADHWHKKLTGSGK